MAKLPEGWIVADLGEFCEGIRGVTYKPDDLAQVNTEKTITLLRSNNIKAGALNFKDVQHVAQKNVNQKQVAQLGDIAVCMSNGSKRLVGKSAAFKHIPEGRRYTVGSFCSIFRPLESACPVFVEQVFCSDQFQKQVDFSLAGSAINNLKNSDLISYQFLKPPIPEQQKIATILSSVDNVIEKIRAQIDKLKDLKTGMMQELLTKGIGHTEFKDSPVGRIPQEWEVKPLTEAIEVKHGFQFRENHFHDTGMPVVKIKNLTYNSFVDMEGCSFVPKTVFPNYASFLVEKGDILMALTGATLGKVSVYDSTSPSLQNYRVGNFYPKHNVMIKHYVFWILQSEFVQQRVEELVNEAAQPNIGKADLEGMLIPVPSCFEQVKITDTLDAIFDRYMLLEKKLNQLKCQKKALMQDLLTGKVRVNLTDKESAVV